VSWGGGQISLKTLKAEKLGSNLVGRISTSPRFLMEIARLDSLSLVELGGEYFGKIKKIEAFVTYEKVIRS